VRAAPHAAPQTTHTAVEGVARAAFASTAARSTPNHLATPLPRPHRQHPPQPARQQVRGFQGSCVLYCGALHEGTVFSSGAHATRACGIHYAPTIAAACCCYLFTQRHRDAAPPPPPPPPRSPTAPKAPPERPRRGAQAAARRDRLWVRQGAARPPLLHHHQLPRRRRPLPRAAGAGGAGRPHAGAAVLRGGRGAARAARGGAAAGAGRGAAAGGDAAGVAVCAGDAAARVPLQLGCVR